MKLQNLASKPQLVELTIDEEKIVERYGEPLQFFINDRLPVDTYTKLASVKPDDPVELYNIVKDLILDDTGMPVISGENTLPIDVMNAAIIRVTEELGK